MPESARTESERDTRRSVRIELSKKSIGLVLGAVALVWLLAQVWPVLLVVVAALMIVGMLSPFVTRLEHFGWRRSWAIGAVFAGLLACALAFVALTIPRFLAQLTDMLDRFPEMREKLVHGLDQWKLGAPLAKSVRDLDPADVMTRVGRLGIAYSSRIIEVVAYTLTAVFLALYVMIDRDRMRGAVFALIPRCYHVRSSRILLNLETIVGGYMRGQVITSVLMAVFTFVVLTAARVPNALALGLAAGVADVLPYVGAILACGPAVLAALSRGPTVAIIVAVVLLAYQELESRFIVPRVYGKVLRLPAAVVMVSLLVGGKLLGILGALLALPIAAGLRMIAEELRVELPGEVFRDSAIRKADEREERLFERRAAGAPVIEAAAIAAEIAEARIEHDARGPEAAAEVPLSKGLRGSDGGAKV